MSDIIQMIWEGTYVPVDEFGITPKDLKELWDKTNHHSDDFIAKLDEPLKQEFKILMDEHFNLLSAELGRIHSEGFKLAIKIIYESISGHNQELNKKIFDLAYDTYEKAEEKEKELDSITKEDFVKDILSMENEHPATYYFFLIFLELSHLGIIDNTTAQDLLNKVGENEEELNIFILRILRDRKER